MPWYATGTLTVASNGTTATGAGTAFLGNVRVGDGITIAGSSAIHEVTGVTSNTQLTFAPAYTGAAGSGKAYRIAPIQGYDRDLADAFNQLRLQFGNQLSALQPWATAASAPIALDNLGFSDSGKTVATGTPAQSQTALELVKQASANDAVAGRLMTVGAFGWNGGAAIPIGSTIDADTITTSGLYVFGSNGVNLPLPAMYPFLWVSGSSNGSSIKQVAHASNTNRMAIRTRFNGVWSAWDEQLSRSNILGTVSQSGGVATGAIIEYISNANGEAWRFAGGLQFCRRQVDYNIRQAGTVSFGMAASFIAIPTQTKSWVNGLNTAQDAEQMASCVDYPTTGSFRLVRGTDKGGAVTDVSLVLIATGKWA